MLSETVDWDERPTRKSFKEFTKGHAGLTELRLKSKGMYGGKIVKTQIRPLGILKRSDKRFIFLNGCEKHGHLETIPTGCL